MAIDTLGFTKYVEEHGVARDQAEAHAEAANQFLFPQLATTTDIQALRTEFDADLQSIRADMVALKADLTLRTIGIVGALNALLFTLLKLT
jgi:hypothetical protein